MTISMNIYFVLSLAITLNAVANILMKVAMLRQGKTKWYRCYWLFANIAWLGVAVFSFTINFRLVEVVQYTR